jgi:transcription antitermination factor NusG
MKLALPLPVQFESWAALRCLSAKTLQLADNLMDRGVVGWSPRASARFRIPRTRKTELRTVPLLPSFVFVPYPHADAALDLGQRGSVPRAWPFLFNGDRPAVPVDQLVAMQGLGPHKMAELFKPGEPVRFVVGPLHGRTGTIVTRKGRDRWLVDVGGRRVLVPSFLIAANPLQPPTS